MRDIFPAHFRPSIAELGNLWKTSIVAVDANVLLNLYRYSPETRRALEDALASVKTRLFLPHQAAKEFLKNRISVTAAQADEYSKAVKTLNELAVTLSNKKKHPFLPDAELPNFTTQIERLKTLLEEQQSSLLARLTNDEILESLESLFSKKTGQPFNEGALAEIEKEGEIRYAKDVPPGYKDGKKDSSGDPLRKFGDLIVWKQLIKQSMDSNQPIIFVTDDKKEDWWQEQSGRTIGPRTELREEFVLSAKQDFWMYTVDLFIEEAARLANQSVSQEVINEIKEVREEVNTARYFIERPYNNYHFISKDELLNKLALSEKWSKSNADGFVGLQSFVRKHLGEAGFDHGNTFELIRTLESEGLVETYPHHSKDFPRPVTAIRTYRLADFQNRPFEDLKDVFNKEDEKLAH